MFPFRGIFFFFLVILHPRFYHNSVVYVTLGISALRLLKNFPSIHNSCSILEAIIQCGKCSPCFNGVALLCNDIMRNYVGSGSLGGREKLALSIIYKV